MLYNITIDKELLHIFLLGTTDSEVTLLFNPNIKRRIMLKNSKFELEVGINSKKTYGERIFQRYIDEFDSIHSNEDIIKAVCKQLKEIDVNFFRVNSRKTKIVYARKLISFILYKTTPYTYSKIGEIIRCEDKKTFNHSSIMHNVNYISKRYDSDESIKNDVDAILAYLEKNPKLDEAEIAISTHY